MGPKFGVWVSVQDSRLLSGVGGHGRSCVVSRSDAFVLP